MEGRNALKFKAERRTKRRKIFRKCIFFEQVITELNRMKNIQRNGVCLNISESGLGFTTDVGLSRGEVIKLFIPASTVGTTVPVFSEVMWARPTNDHFRTGLRFLQ